jgi:hypothetical protein
MISLRAYPVQSSCSNTASTRLSIVLRSKPQIPRCTLRNSTYLAVPGCFQGIAISYINSMGEISNPEDGKALQNFMICVEMALAGISLLYAFPHKEFNMGGSTHGWRLDAFLHAISIKDVVVDTIHVVSMRSWQWHPRFANAGMKPAGAAGARDACAACLILQQCDCAAVYSKPFLADTHNQ